MACTHGCEAFFRSGSGIWQSFPLLHVWMLAMWEEKIVYHLRLIPNRDSLSGVTKHAPLLKLHKITLPPQLECKKWTCWVSRPLLVNVCQSIWPPYSRFSVYVSVYLSFFYPLMAPVKSSPKINVISHHHRINSWLQQTNDEYFIRCLDTDK